MFQIPRHLFSFVFCVKETDFQLTCRTYLQIHKDFTFFCLAIMSLQNFFAELQDREREFGISDIQLGLTTLEEVFLNIARQAELESAAAEGSLATLTLTSGTSVQVCDRFAIFIVH